MGGSRHTHPTQDDGVLAALSEAVGGPAGERIGPSLWWTPLRVLLGLTAVVFVLGLVSQSSCVAHQWEDDPTIYRHVCSSEVADSYTGTALVELSWPWSDDPGTRSRYPVTDQPALVGLWTYAAARVTHVLAGSPDIEQRYRTSVDDVAADPDVRRERTIYMGVNALGLAALALLTTVALSRLHRRRPWDAAGFAAAPLLALTALVSWDLLAVAAVAGALWAWSRSRPVLAGVLVGVGAAAGVWPALLVVAFLLDSVRRHRLPDVLPVAVTGTAVWAAINAPAFLSGRAQWERFWSLATHHEPNGSLWVVLADVADLGGGTARVLSWVLLAGWLAGVVVLALRSRVVPRPAQVALLLVAGPLLLAVSYEPHQALWLLPLAALARPRWRDLLVWQAGEVLFLALDSWYRGGVLDPGGDGPPGFYWIGIGVHLAATGYLVAVVVRDVWWAPDDPVSEERGPDRGQLMSMESNDVAV
ncbi:glycosyltransferase 87 family protein [soil metagenome]